MSYNGVDVCNGHGSKGQGSIACEDNFLLSYSHFDDSLSDSHVDISYYAERATFVAHPLPLSLDLPRFWLTDHISMQCPPDENCWGDAPCTCIPCNSGWSTGDCWAPWG
jgi:hypothetical protein